MQKILAALTLLAGMATLVPTMCSADTIAASAIQAYGDPSLRQIENICVGRRSNQVLEMYSYSNGVLLCDVDHGAYEGDLLFQRDSHGLFHQIPTINEGMGGINFQDVHIPDATKIDLLYHETWIDR